MKREYAAVPPRMANMEAYGFSWMDFVTAIPSPLFVVTTYKSNGLPNACLQSWACFNGDPDGFHAILSSVNKSGHLYRTIHETGVAVLNFPSADIYDRCMATIRCNGFDQNEIAEAGLTSEPASLVNAPRIAECFCQLECRFLWEKEITEGSSHVLMCLNVVNICMDEEHLQNRYGDKGYLYNVHYPVNPETYPGRGHDWIASLHPLRDMGEY